MEVDAAAATTAAAEAPAADAKMSAAPGTDVEADAGAGAAAKQHDAVFAQRIHSPLTFSDIECWVPGRTKKILHGVSGFVEPGEMLAVMGPSGSGKTTMLNVLSQKLPRSLVGGSMRIGARLVTKRDRRNMGFVFQDDLMLSNLTVRDTVLTSAELKLPVDMPAEEKARRVDALIDVLGLSKVSGQRIGSIGMRGISGGERKRTAVANELVTAPAVLFLDEPTSGLDSTTALALAQMLRVLCDNGMTIVCCIHQPRENIFAQFDRLLLLADGRTAYFGPAAQCREYLEAISVPSRSPLTLPPFTNVADWILDLMSDPATAADIQRYWAANDEARVALVVAGMRGEGGTAAAEAAAAAVLPVAETKSGSGDKGGDDAVASVADGGVVVAVGAAGHGDADAGAGEDEDEDEDEEAAESCRVWCHKFATLSRRNLLQKRGVWISPIVIVNVIITSIVTGICYWQTESANDLVGAIFFCLINQGYLSSIMIMRLFPEEKFLMRRERSSKYYSLSAYFMAKCAVDAVSSWVSPIVYMLIVYFCVGFQVAAANFFLFLATFVVFIITAESFGLLVSCSFDDFGTAAAVNTIYLLTSMLVGGFYVEVDLIPVWLVWLKWLGIVVYGFTGLLRTEFEVGDPQFPCTAGRDGQYGVCTDAAGQEVSYPNGTFSGQQVLEFNSTPDIDPGYCILILLLFTVGFRFAAYLALRFCGKPPRNGGRSGAAGCCGSCRNKKDTGAERPEQGIADGAEPAEPAASDGDADVAEVGSGSGSATDGATATVEMVELVGDGDGDVEKTEGGGSSGGSGCDGDGGRGRPEVRRQLTNIDVSEKVAAVSVAFTDLGYEVVTDRKTATTRHILQGIDGHIAAGSLVALMGPSGAGKTTLLNTIALRDSGGKVAPESSILYNGHEATAAVKSRCGFVFQDDLMLSRLTVRETIMIAAELKLPPDTTRERKEERVSNVIATLRLDKVADSLVGGQGLRGVSGGERKRTALATELITDPSILFLDEPTTGLDSSTALEVVRILSDLCLTHMTVICSIHQPRSSIFQTFDQLLLLSAGRTAYFGPVCDVVRHMETTGLPGSQLPPQTNVADWVLDLLDNEDNAATITAAWQAHNEAQKGSLALVTKQMSQLAPLEARQRPNCCHQFSVLIHRVNRQEAGQLFDFTGGLSTIALSVVAGAIWFQSQDVTSLFGVLFFLLLNQSFTSVLSTTRIFPPQRNLMLRETSLGYYGVFPYFMAQTLYDTVAGLAVPLVFGTVLYFMAGLTVTAQAYFTAMGVLLLTVVTAQSLGLFIACSVMDVGLASAIIAIVILFFMLLGGFYVSTEGVLDGLSWIKYLSFIYWGFAALVHNEFDDGRPDVMVAPYTEPPLEQLPLIPCSWAKENEWGPCWDPLNTTTVLPNSTYPNGFINGTTIVDGLGFANETIGFSCGMLAVLAVGYRMLACLMLWVQTQSCCANGCCRRA